MTAIEGQFEDPPNEVGISHLCTCKEPDPLHEPAPVLTPKVIVTLYWCSTCGKHLTFKAIDAYDGSEKQKARSEYLKSPQYTAHVQARKGR